MNWYIETEGKKTQFEVLQEAKIELATMPKTGKLITLCDADGTVIAFCGPNATPTYSYPLTS